MVYYYFMCTCSNVHGENVAKCALRCAVRLDQVRFSLVWLGCLFVFKEQTLPSTSVYILTSVTFSPCTFGNMAVRHPILINA